MPLLGPTVGILHALLKGNSGSESSMKLIVAKELSSVILFEHSGTFVTHLLLTWDVS